MSVLIDACVLVPSLTRRLVLATDVTPLWSAEILAEWRHAVAKLGVAEAAEVGTEIALIRARYPKSEVEVDSALVAALDLPDADDRHVLAGAIAGQADALLTFNTKDFPLRALAAHGVIRRHPDEFLVEAAHEDDTALLAVLDAEEVRTGRSRRALLRGSHLPRLSKLLTR